MEQTVPTLAEIDQIVTEAVVAEYWERGYWISPKLFDDAEINKLRAAHDRLWARDFDYEIPPQYGVMPFEPDTPKVRQQVNAYWLSAEIRRAVTSPILGKIGARLMGVDLVRLWHDQAIYKPGIRNGELTDAGNIGWHQDYGFWKACSSTNMCTAWVALQDTDLTNGGMRTIVGSHKWGLVEESNTFGHKDLEQLAERFSKLGKSEWIDEPCILKAGQVSFHHALTFHGSGPNLTDQPRLSVIAHMMPGDSVYRAGQQWHPALVFLGYNAYDGQPFPPQYFPQMWPPAGDSKQ